MGKEFDAIDERITNWIERQNLFFVSTAPLAESGLVNCSPKGQDTLRILDSKTLAYLDLGGSGVETIAHLKENGRIVIMMCAFEGPPKIFRFYGKGEVLEPDHPEFTTVYANFPAHRMPRAIIRVKLSRIADSCGFSVPLMKKTADRTAMDKWLDNKSDEDLVAYRKKNNATSLDGLPGVNLDIGG